MGFILNIRMRRRNEEEEKVGEVVYDIVVIGAGIAGMTSVLYGARAGKKVLLLEAKSYGGQIVNANEVENYPGVIKIDGFTLMKNLYDQIKTYDIEYKQEEVISLKNQNTVVTTNNEYQGKTIIIATGLKNRTLGLYGEADFIGRGVSYCATCDGNFYRGREVALVGGGNTALEEALYLSNIVKKVYLIHRRDTFRVDQILIDKVCQQHNIEIILSANVVELKGEEYLEEIILDNERQLKVSALFLAIGKIPDARKFSSMLELDEQGYIISDDTTTKIANIFVAGDCRTKKVRQLVTAASDGAIAAMCAIEYLNNI